MTQRLICPPAPGPLEEYAGQFDDLFGSLAQRRSFRNYVHGLLLPRDRNKTLTALANAEPISGAQAAPVQRLQFFLSEAPWDATTINRRRLELLQTDPATTPHAGVNTEMKFPKITDPNFLNLATRSLLDRLDHTSASLFFESVTLSAPNVDRCRMVQ